MNGLRFNQMKNSSVLMFAAVLCGLNTILIVWSSWTSSYYRSQLRDAQVAITESSKSIEDLQRKFETQAIELRIEIEEIKREIRASSRMFDKILELPDIPPKSNPFKQKGF